MKTFFKALLASVGLGTVSLSSGAIAQDVSEQPTFEEALTDTENWREVDPENLIIFEISTALGRGKGTVLIETADFAAPNHARQFKAIVRSGDFDGTKFHRVIEDFMAQGGDVGAIKPEADWPNLEQEFVFARSPFVEDSDVPAMQLLGKPQDSKNGYIHGFPVQTQLEYLASISESGTVESWIVHCPGVVSTARGSSTSSADTQFFLMRSTKPHLDKTYTAWGRIVSGLEVVMDIKTGPIEGTVKMPDVLSKAVMAADIPEEERPRVLVQRTDGPDFQKVLQDNEGADVCSLPPVPTIVAE